MAVNAPLTPTWMGRDVLRVASNETRFVKNITKKGSSDFTVAATKVGDTVGVRLPQRFVTNKGSAFVGQSLTDQVVFVTITDQANIGWGYSSSEAIFNVQDARERYNNPAGTQMANTWDVDMLGRLYQDVYNNEGTPGTIPSANETYTNGRARLTNFATPSDSRVMVVNALMMAKIAGANIALFGPGKTRDAMFEDAVMPQATDALGWKQWWEDVNVFPHVYGTYTVAGVVDGANQTGASLLTKTWTSGALKKGDTFTIAGVFAVNPQSYQNTTQLQQFVVTNDVSDAAGAMTIPISPSIITSGAYKTVTASPADAAVITFTANGTTSPQGLGFHKQAFVMAFADPVMPRQGVAKVIRKDGAAIRIWEASDIMTDQHPTRLDSWYGGKTLRADWALRINS